ncbi:sodium/calcium exchanger family protein [Leifsonia sp. LS1]|uniref:sodium:proton exchanger n=1 Tax=Leifsonia sp. LS1 TaxID=2828483 RepID=UPI001CFE86B1|nr:sodium:proton exchanger [Leifsonia sp. LS1]GIT78576.1 sodium/calcium exchanger family protein [Leifsonia sp. LS1]
MSTRTTGLARRLVIPLGIVGLVAAQGVALRLSGIEPAPVVGIVMFGLAIVAAAFALAWAGEAAEVDISGGLAVGLLAIIAILPEYAIDLYFAFTAGSDPSQAQYAAANMTGSNRLLLGFGWPFILLVAFLVYRAARARKRPVDPDVSRRPFAVRLPGDNRVELGLLMIASVLTLTIPLTGQIHVLLGVVLLALFVYYLWKVSTGESEEPELVGVPAAIGGLSTIARRTTVIAIFALSAAVILLLAEPFAHSLIQGGRAAGIDDFLLVQWLAPLASEAPEFVIAIIFAMRGKAAMGVGILLASKVNQWTALVGTLPIAHALGGGGWALPMDGRQVEEFVLTATQTLLGVAMLLSLRFSGRWATALFVLFAATFVFTGTEARWIVSGVYAVLAVALFAFQWRRLWPTLRAPFRRALPHDDDIGADAHGGPRQEVAAG